MKKSLLSTIAAMTLSLASFNAHASSPSMTPQIINGSNPRPDAASTSVLPSWVQTVLTALHLM